MIIYPLPVSIRPIITKENRSFSCLVVRQRDRDREANGGDGEAIGGDLRLHLIFSDSNQGDR
jgi:hypothetical protein